jgi:hypothetical protein
VSARRLGRLSNRTYSSQCFIDRLLPIGHRVPLTRHFAISGLDMRISHPGCAIRIRRLSADTHPHDSS